MYKWHSSIVDLCCQLYIQGLIGEVGIFNERVVWYFLMLGRMSEAKANFQGKADTESRKRREQIGLGIPTFCAVNDENLVLTKSWH